MKGTNEIWLIGSGPSAHEVRPPDNVRVACVNGSANLYEGATGRLPDYYCVGEIEGVRRFYRRMNRYARAGVEVFTRPAAWKAFPSGGPLNGGPLHPHIRVIPYDFGPPELHILHRNRPLSGSDHTPWMSTGVVMLWYLAEVERPQHLVVAGLDGYPVDGDEYAPGAGESLPRTPQWREAMNARMAGAIKSITNYYTGTEFVWLQRPRHWRKGWRVTIRGES